MKKTIFYSAITTVLAAGVSTLASSQAMESTVTAKTETSVSVDYASSYVFRGTTLNKGAVLQPALGVETGAGISIGFWGNVDIDDNDGTAEENQFSEMDLIVGYTLPLPDDRISASVGATEYLYPNSNAESDREVNLTVGVNVPLNPTVSMNYGVGGAVDKNMYTELGVGQEVYNKSGITAGVAAALGHIIPEDDEAETGLTHGLVSANMGYKMVNASVNYVVETDEEVNDLEEQEEFFVTIGAGTTF